MHIYLSWVSNTLVSQQIWRAYINIFWNIADDFNTTISGNGRAVSY